MKIPKYIDRLLERRAKAAKEFLTCDIEICDWLNKHEIKVSSDDIFTGACSLCEAENSIKYIRQCIREK